MINYIIGILERVIGILIIAISLSFLFRKITKVDTIKQKFIAALIATTLCIVISAFIAKATENFNALPSWIVHCFYGWLITISLFVYKFNWKQFLASVLYVYILWAGSALIISIGVLIGVRVFEVWHNNDFIQLLGTISLGASFLVTPFLVYRHKLPFTKSLFCLVDKDIK